jgi:hypothetical protein
MGKLDQQRNFVCIIVPGSCSASLPSGYEADVVVMDLMPCMAMILDKRFPFFDAHRVATRITDCIRYWMNNERNPDRVITTNSFVVLMDTPHYVPKNKAATQKRRDASRVNTATTTDHTEEGVDEPIGPFMDEQMYNELVQARGGDTESLFIDVGVQSPPNLKSMAVWRSKTLSFQFRRLLTMYGMQLDVPPQQTLIFDEGVAVSTDRFNRVRRDMIVDNHWEKRSAFERECLVHASMIKNGFYSRLILYDDRQFHRAGVSMIGEADIKWLSYLQPHNGAKKLVYINPDTDIPIITGLHFSHYLAGFTEEEARDVSVWLDMQSPMKHNEKKAAYRFIDAKAQYLGLLRFMTEEYPDVTHPIETFYVLMLLPHTDFTAPFETAMGLTVRQIWDAFSELHSCKTARNAPGFVTFSDNLEKGIQRSHTLKYHNSMRGILNNTVSYDPVSRQFHIEPETMSRFLYYLCQAPVMRARQRIGLTTLDVKAVMPIQHLLLCARELGERLDAYKAYTAGQFGSLVQQQQQSDVNFTDLFDTLVAPAPALSETEMKAYITKYGPELALLSGKTKTSLFGVPTRQSLNATMRRLVWYMKMCRHGYESMSHMNDCGASDEASGLSLYGWRNQESTGINSNYNDVQLIHGRLTCYETLECDEVIIV